MEYCKKAAVIILTGAVLLTSTAPAFAQTTPSSDETPAFTPASDVSPAPVSVKEKPALPAPEEEPLPEEPPPPRPPQEPPPQDEAQSGGGSPPGPTGEDTPGAPPYSSVQPVPSSYQVRPEVDQSTGALTYRYPLTLPPGRNGMTPELSLTYNSQDRRDGSPVGYGWSMSVPAIERQNLTGIHHLFTDEHFTSSLSGELTRIAAGAAPNNFSARIDDGSFVRYTFAGNGWTAQTKSGARYTFGASGASRLFDPVNDPNGTKTAKWLLDSIEDTNSNRITFNYIRDQNQLYLDTITYTDTSAGTGPFLITFIRALRPDADRTISYANEFRTETRYRVSEIQAAISGQLAVKYALGYTQSPTNNRSLLASITQTGYDAAGVATTLPPTSFAYTPSNMGFSAGPNPFGTITVPQTQGSSLRHGFLIADVNGDAYADLVRSYEYNNALNPSANFSDRRVWINNHAGSFVESTAWTGASAMPLICTDGEPLRCAGNGVTLVDQNGDALADYFQAAGGNGYLGTNTGNGWDFTNLSSTYSLVATYPYRPSMAPFDGANPPFVLEVSDSNWIIPWYNTASNFGNRVADVNHDGLPDVVRSTGNSTETNGLDEAVYLNTGIGAGEIVRFAQIGWQFLNGTNIGANAPAANAIFEHTAPKEAFLADMNGDDLPDVVKNGNTLYRHTGNAWVYDSAPVLFTEPHEETQVADVNGDGLLDFVVSDPCESVHPAACVTRAFYNMGQVPDLLQTVTLPAGGAVTAAYKASSAYQDASGALLNPNLPMAIETVERITETDPVTSVSGATVYTYAGGKYFFENLVNRRFAGFATVTAAKPDGSKAVSYFNVAEDPKIGKPFRTDLLDASGNPVSRTLTAWQTTALSAIAGSRFLTVPQDTVSLDFGAGGAYRARAARAAYDTASGALLSTIDYGEVNVADPTAPAFTDLGADARTTVYSYAADPAGIFQLPATRTLTDSAGTTVAQTRTYYDSLPLGQASAGNQTKTEQLINPTTNTYAQTTRTYTPTGLVQTETDPLGHTMSFTYDALGLYPATVTNALGQQTVSAYDYTSGKPVTVTDPNGEVRRTVYDGLDRVKEEWAPHPATGVSVLTHTVVYTDQPNQTAANEAWVSEGVSVSNTHSIDLEDSSLQFLSHADTAPLSITGDMTIEAWVKPESAPADGNDFVIASKSSSAGGRSYYFYYHNTSGVFSLKFAISPNGAAQTFGSVNYTLSTVAWTHVAVVYTASTGSVEFFVNGASIGSASGLSTSIFDGDGEFDVGARFTGGGNEAFFDGLMDDVRVWNVARTGTQIMATKDHALSGNEANLKGYWRMDGATTDSTLNAATLAVSGSAVFSSDVPFGGGTASVATVKDSHAYFDGFGRPIQKRERAEGTGAGGLPVYTASDTHYDNEGRVNKVSLPYASLGTALTQAVTSPAILTISQYDAAGRVVSVSDAVGTTLTAYDRWDTTVTDPNGHQKKFGKDASGQLTRVEEFPAGVPPAVITSYEYDPAGNLKTITDADLNVRNFAYDARGLRLSAEDLHPPLDVDPDSTPFFGTYTFTYDVAGNLTQKRTPKGDTVAYVYDALNRELSEDFSGTAGTEVAYTYDACMHGVGRRCSETASGVNYSFSYNLAGNVAQEIATIGPSSYSTSYGYDQLGNVTRVTHPNGSATLYTLNESGRTETVSWQATPAAASAPLVTDIDYAPQGAVAKLSRANGLEETFIYDALAKYRLTEHVVGQPGSGAPPGVPNTHSIDLEDALNQYLFTPQSAPLSLTGDMTIEAWVKPESAPTDGNDFVIASKSGSAGSRAYYLEYHNTTGTFSLRIRVSSNGTATVIGSVNTTLTVGAWTHLAAVYHASLGTVEFFVNGVSIGTASGLPTAIYHGNGEFDVGARFTGGGHEAFFDGLMDDVRVWNEARDLWSIAQSMQGNAVGDPSRLKARWRFDNTFADASGNGNTLDNPLNAVFVTDVPWSGGSSTVPPLSRRTYTYDSVGNVLSTVESGGGATITSTYSYDPLDRLVNATAATQTATSSSQTVSNYGYGPTGNLLTGPSGAYRYDGFSGGVYVNPHAATKVGNRTLGYDPNGNLTSDIGGTVAIANSWNYRNELTNTAIAQTSVAYKYDSAGQRVSLIETAPTGVTTTRFPTPSYSETTRPDNSVERTVSIEVAGIPIATIRTVDSGTPEVFADHTDHLGSTRLATDQTGAVVEKTDYDPFGKITTHTQTSDFAERKKFTSHEFDSATNYTYAKARYLDTEAGRFVSEDPKFWSINDALLLDPQQQNSYAYARNNPVKYVDPDGASIKDFGGPYGSVPYQTGELFGSYKGVNIYHNGGNYDSPYQCPEFADRFIAQEWKASPKAISAMVADGKDYTAPTLNASLGQKFATSYNNQVGNTLPTEDSLIAFGPSTNNSNGHVAVIGAVSFNEKTGTGSITIAQQNAPNFKATLGLSKNANGAYAIQNLAGMSAIGWTAPAKANATPSNTSSGSSLSAIARMLNQISRILFRRANN